MSYNDLPPPQPQQTSAPATTTSAIANPANPRQTPQITQVATPAQQRHAPTSTGELTEKYTAPPVSPPLSHQPSLNQQPSPIVTASLTRQHIAPSTPSSPSYQHPGQQYGPTATAGVTGQHIAPSTSPPPSYQQPSSQWPPQQHPHAQQTMNGSPINPSWNGHHMQHVNTMPNPNHPSQPAMVHHASHPQPQRPMQFQTGDIPYQMNEKSPSMSQAQGTVNVQPELVKEMQFAEMSEEERKKQRRAEQIKKAKHCAGQTCIITGKICVVSFGIAATMCSCIMCMTSCMGGGGGGIMGGDSGGLVSFGGDFGGD